MPTHILEVQRMKFAFSAHSIIFAESINTDQEVVFIPCSVVPIFLSITVENKV